MQTQSNQSTNSTTDSNIQKRDSAGDFALKLLAKDFAFHCRRLRIGLRMTQEVFARKMGVRNEQGKITVSRWESGKTIPQKRYLVKFLQLQKVYDQQEQ